jgi:hypothetical protein
MIATAVAFFFAHSSLNEVERMQGPDQVYVVHLQREQGGEHLCRQNLSLLA